MLSDISLIEKVYTLQYIADTLVSGIFQRKGRNVNAKSRKEWFSAPYVFLAHL